MLPDSTPQQSPEKLAEPIGLADGRWVPWSQMQVSVHDLGFIHGVTVAEQLRTIGGRVFQSQAHYHRWDRGLRLLGLPAPVDFDQLDQWIKHVVHHNAQFLPDGCVEQAICYFATPGVPRDTWALAASGCAGTEENQKLSNVNSSQTTFHLYSYPLNTELHRKLYQTGARLFTSDFADVTSSNWPKTVKVRSRLHYYLAQRQASQQAQLAYPILLDNHGRVSDSSIASIVAWDQQRGLIVRPSEDRYASVSVQFLVELCKKHAIPVKEELLVGTELCQCDELFLASTPWCLCPVASVDGYSVPSALKGFPTFRRLLGLWEESVDSKIWLD